MSRMSGTKTKVIGAMSFALLLIGLARADVDWKWDTSGHVETPPATASIAISTMLPDTAKQASDEGCLNIFSFLWLDSNPFKLSGSPLGIFIVIR